MQGRSWVCMDLERNWNFGSFYINITIFIASIYTHIYTMLLISVSWMQTQYSYEIICIFIKLPENFLLTFLDVKSLMMVSISISFNNCFSMHNVVNPINLSCEELCDYIKLFYWSVLLYFIVVRSILSWWYGIVEI